MSDPAEIFTKTLSEGKAAGARVVSEAAARGEVLTTRQAVLRGAGAGARIGAKRGAQFFLTTMLKILMRGIR